MAISQADVDRIEESIAAPEREVQDGRRRVERRSVTESIEALNHARSMKARAEGKRRVKKLRAVLSPD